MALLEERKKPTDSQPRNTDYLEEHAPVLLEMMSIVPKGSTGDKTCSLLIFCEDGEFKVLVNDRAVTRKAWLRMESLDEDFFKIVEHFVTEDHTEWRFPKVGDNGRSQY